MTGLKYLFLEVVTQLLINLKKNIGVYSKPRSYFLVVYSKQPILELTQSSGSEFKARMCSPQQVTHLPPPPQCVIFYFPWHKHQLEGTNIL